MTCTTELKLIFLKKTHLTICISEVWHSTARQYLILTSIFGPLQNGRDLVALLGFADAIASGRVNADGVEVGLHAAQVGRGRGRTVGDLEVHAVRLHRSKHTEAQYFILSAVFGKSEVMLILFCLFGDFDEDFWHLLRFFQLFYLDQPHTGEGVHGHHSLLTSLILQLSFQDSSRRVCCYSHTWGTKHKSQT